MKKKKNQIVIWFEAKLYQLAFLGIATLLLDKGGNFSACLALMLLSSEEEKKKKKKTDWLLWPWENAQQGPPNIVKS